MYKARVGKAEARGVATALAMFLAAGAATFATAQEPEYQEVPEGAESADAYGYFRVMDGDATLLQAGSGERIRVQTNEPVLVGDQIFLSSGRAEIVLADHNLIRIGDDAELGLEALANSPDAADRVTIIELRRGKLQLVVVEGQLGDEYPTILTPNATIRILDRGSYFVDLDGGPRTELVVRDGRAEVSTEFEVAEVRVGEELRIEGRSGDRIRYADARGLDGLERWGRDLAYYRDGEYRDYVDSDLYYGASSLYGHGQWVTVGARYAWRPYVGAGWLPYHHGRWRYTPTGMFWVSYEPWGWVPYHYGSWDFVGGYGWVWYPGRYFRPAHVYWYWGPHYAGWIPSGYYNRHYGHYYGRGFGFYGGVYGYLGGGFGPFRYWVFSPLGRLGHYRQHQYVFNGYELSRRQKTLGRGILTTDTRHLRPELWRRPTDALHTLRRVGGATAARDLPNARPFVERVAKLPPTLERTALRGIENGRLTGRPARADLADIEARSPNALPRQRNAAALERGGVGERTNRGLPTVERRQGAETLRRPETRSAGERTLEREAAGRTGAARPTARPTGRTQPGVTRPEARRPTAQPRGEDARRTLERPTRQAPAARPERPSTIRPQVERPTARPQARPTSRPAPRPQARPSGRSGSRPQARPTSRPAPRPTARPSGRSGGSRPQARPTSRPAPRPQARPTSRPAPRPTARSTSRPAPRPTARPSGRSGGSRPQARPTSRPAPRPQARPSSRPAPRPQARSSGRSAPRPQARPSRPAPRPQARPSSRSAPRPQARPASRSAPRPQARPSSRSAPRPQVRRSSSRSRPTARRGGGGDPED